MNQDNWKSILKFYIKSLTFLFGPNNIHNKKLHDLH